MNIFELESFNLADAVKFHDRLNHRLWDRSEHLHPQVKDRLMAVAQDFQEFLGVPDLDVKDITISGSNAAYNYTDNSDIDLHLVVEIPQVQHDEVYRELFNAKKYQYNDQHNIRIGGADVELYAQPSDQPHHSQGIYSLLRNAWIQVPRRRQVTIDDSCVRAKYEDLSARIDDAVASGSSDRMRRLQQKIKTMRQTGLEQQGEFGCDNLVFKMLRARGAIKRLIDARNAAHAQELSLNERRKKAKARVRYGFGGYWAPGFAFGDAGEGGGDGGGGGEGRYNESPDGVDPSTKMFLEDESANIEQTVRDFIDFTAGRLGITRMPEIELHRDSDWSAAQHSFGRYTPETHTLEVSLADRHIMDILRTTAHELVHCRQNQDSALPDEAGQTGSQWENQAHAVAGVIMRDFADHNPRMFESSGYIPTEAEKNDPRFLMALSPDVRPGATGLNANRMRLKTNAQGRPQLLRADGRVSMTEAQSAKTGIYQTDVLGAKAYHAKCMEPNCGWESKRFDRIKQAQAAAEKHAKGHFKQGVAEGSEIQIPTEDGIGWQDIRLLAGEGKLTQKTIKQAIDIIRKQRKEQSVAEGSGQDSFVQRLGRKLQQSGYTQTGHGTWSQGPDGREVSVTPLSNGQYGWELRRVNRRGKWYSGVDTAKAVVSIFKEYDIFSKHPVDEGLTEGFNESFSPDELSILNQYLNDEISWHELKRGYRDLVVKAIKRFDVVSMSGVPMEFQFHDRLVQARDEGDLREQGVAEGMPQPSQGPGKYRDLNKPLGPESPPTMPAGTVRVDVSDVYDWYKLGQHISNMKGLGRHDFGAGPPSTILSFGDEDLEHQYLDALKKTGLTTTDIDPVDPNQPPGMPRQKTDPTYNIDEGFDDDEEKDYNDLFGYKPLDKLYADELKQAFDADERNQPDIVARRFIERDGNTYKYRVRLRDGSEHDMFLTHEHGTIEAWIDESVTENFADGRNLAEAGLQFHADVPNEEWLQHAIDYVKKQPKDGFGRPRMIEVTGTFSRPVVGSIARLAGIPGARGEQSNVREGDLRAIMKIMRETGKLPLGKDGREYIPLIGVDYTGKPWVLEGNHRIMAAWNLYTKERIDKWDRLPVEIRYFDGGERVKDGPLYPGRIAISENFADGRNPQDKGDSKRYGVPTKASVSTLRKVAKQGGRKGQLAHWMANMKAGRAKARRQNESLEEVRINNQSGVGAVPYNAEINYQGLQVEMRPSMFLKLALPMDPHDPEDRKAIEFCKSELTQKGIGAPFLTISVPEAWEQGDFSQEARVKGHDGRHRCYAILEKESDDPIEVHIIVPYMKRRHITDEIIKNLRNGIMNQLGQYVRGPIFGEAK